MASKFSYGGQAVIEGVMIRGQKAAAVAVRRPNGKITSLCEPLSGVYTGSLRKVPMVRGVIVLAETIALGMRALMYSANVSLEEEDAPQDGLPKQSKAMWVMLPLALLFSVGLFFVTPLLLANWLNIESPMWFAAAEGGIRMVLFVAYIGGVSLMPDMRRVFAYHGAEHMTIAAHEHGHALEAGEIRKFPKEHPRCGTAFLITVMLFSVLVFSLFGAFHPPLWATVLSRILFVPLIASGSYEIIKFNAAHQNSWIGKLGMTPGIWLQYLTTRKPDDDQIEVAVAAMNAALVADGAQAPAPAEAPQEKAPVVV
jgi:uncharacterized protein YqhQ